MEQNEKDAHIETIDRAANASILALANVNADSEIDMQSVAEKIADAFEEAREKIRSA